MLRGTRAELQIACGILRRLRFRDPDLEISVHDTVRRLETCLGRLEDGDPVTRQLAVEFVPPPGPTGHGRGNRDGR